VHIRVISGSLHQPKPSTKALNQNPQPKPSTKALNQSHQPKPSTKAINQSHQPKPSTKALNQSPQPKPSTKALNQSPQPKPSTKVFHPCSSVSSVVEILTLSLSPSSTNRRLNHRFHRELRWLKIWILLLFICAHACSSVVRILPAPSVEALPSHSILSACLNFRGRKECPAAGFAIEP
jgi:hypothetical protein